MMTFVSGLAAGLAVQVFRFLWRRFRYGPKAAPFGPIGDLMMEPIHRLHRRWVVLPRERQAEKKKYDDAIEAAVLAVATARQVRDRHEQLLGYMNFRPDGLETLAEAGRALRDDSDVERAVELIVRARKELREDYYRRLCDCGKDSAYAARFMAADAEWGDAAEGLSEPLLALSCLDGSDWPVLRFENRLDEGREHLDHAWEKLRPSRDVESAPGSRWFRRRS
ncbi:hypothetical protein [Streptomyces xiamenensis]|uniref:hypothetical protein n=1 Tax=Streptomyces xiamenensis TaxID=408015 RepID=UPI003D72A4ED